MPMDTETRRQIEARHAEVLGQPPRIAPVDREVAAAQVQETTRRLIVGVGGPADMPLPPVGSIPEIMFTLCRFPTLWQAVMDVTVPLQGPASTLPPRDRKLAILRTGWLCAAPYEFGEHVAQAKRLGFSEDEIDAVTTGSTAARWNEHERAILKAVVTVQILFVLLQPLIREQASQEHSMLLVLPAVHANEVIGPRQSPSMRFQLFTDIAILRCERQPWNGPHDRASVGEHTRLVVEYL